nr:S8 family serine peptidase [Leuconostoc mesenteroides]
MSGSTHGEHVAGIIAANGTVADGATGTSKASSLRQRGRPGSPDFGDAGH